MVRRETQQVQIDGIILKEKALKFIEALGDLVLNKYTYTSN